MARDYSSRRNNSSGKGKHKGRRRSTTRARPAAKPAPKKRARGGTPGWVWMICGLCIGLTVAAAFYVFGRPAGTPAGDQVLVTTTDDADAPDQTHDDKAQAGTPPAKKEEKPRFSFYKMLPNYEVVIPQEQYPDESKSASHAANPVGEPPPEKPKQSRNSTPEPTKPTIAEPGRYIIQAGSFSTRGDADRRKAELAMLGLAAQIVDVDLASGKTVYRVQSNTIESRARLNAALGRLRDNRIDTLVMRAKN